MIHGYSVGRDIDNSVAIDRAGRGIAFERLASIRVLPSGLGA